MRRSVRRPVGVCIAVVALSVGPMLTIAAERHSDNESLYSATQYHDWIGYLASDELEGRGTGQVGNEKAGDYIASVWESFGVEPAGDDNTFFQNFQLALSKKIGDATRLSIGTRGRLTRKPAELNQEYVPLPFSSNGAFSGDVVFAGYGIDDSDNGYNDYADIDARDRVVLILRRGPDFQRFGMQHISFRAKADTAREHGAVGLMMVNRDGDAHLYDFDRGGPGGDQGMPMIHVTPDLANQLLAAGGLQDIQTLQDRIERTKSPASGMLDGVSVRARVEIEPVYSDVRNVVGMIPGTGPQKDEMIVLGAHYDHLGVRHKGEPDFDPSKDISNGADDNASGTAMLMQLAKTYTEGEAPNRTLVLVAFTGEELGLLGSEHFAKEPTIDLDKCITMLNFDMVGRLNNDMLEIGGMNTGGFEPMIDRLNESYHFDVRDGGGGRGPSDHTNFYMRDIPVMFFFTGLHKQYHRPEDDTPLINAEGAMRIARFACDVIDTIDSDAKAPTFAKDTRRARIGRQQDRAPKPRTDTTTPRDEAPVRLGVIPMPTEDGNGLLVDSVSDGTPAAKAGMRAGDRIVAIGDQKIESIEDAIAALGKLHQGDQAKVKVIRNDKTLTLDVQFGESREVARSEQRESTPAPHHEHADSASLDRAIVDRIMKFLEAHKATQQLTSISLRKSSRGFEVAASVAWTPGDLSSVSDIIDFVGKSIDDHAKSAGVHYEYSIDLAMHAANGGESYVAVTIRVGHEVGAADHSGSPHRNPHGAANPHGEQTARNPHDAPAATGRPRTSPHGDDAHEPADDVENNTMPPVTLGIMPTYGASEGEGFEIAGVVEGGAADRGGMRDKDRILSIGGKNVTDVYTYMDALRKYKPGDKVHVVVLRDGKHVELTIVTAPPKSPEAS